MLPFSCCWRTTEQLEEMKCACCLGDLQMQQSWGLKVTVSIPLWLGFLQNDPTEMTVEMWRFEQREFPSALSQAREYSVLRDLRLIDRENATQLKRAFSLLLPLVDRATLNINSNGPYHLQSKVFKGVRNLKPILCLNIFQPKFCSGFGAVGRGKKRGVLSGQQNYLLRAYVYF